MAFMSRRLQIGIIVSFCVILVGIAVAWFVVIPNVIDRKVSAALAVASEKTGRHVEVSEIRLTGLSSAHISRITVSDVGVPERTGLTVEDLKVSLSGMPVGQFSISEIAVGELGINLRLDEHTTNFDDILQKLKPKAKVSSGASGAASWKKYFSPFPVISVSEVSISMPAMQLMENVELGAVSASSVSIRASEEKGLYELVGDVSALIVSNGEHQTYESHLSGWLSGASEGVISLSQPRDGNGNVPSVFRQNGTMLRFDNMSFVFPATVEIAGLDVTSGEKPLLSVQKFRGRLMAFPPKKIGGIYFKEVELVEPEIHDYFLDNGSMFLGLVSEFADLPAKLQDKAAQMAQDAAAVALEAGLKAAIAQDPNPGDAIARAVVEDAVRKHEESVKNLRDYFFTQRLFVTNGRFVLEDLRETPFLNAEIDHFDLEIGYRNIRKLLDVDLSMDLVEPLRSEVALSGVYHDGADRVNGVFSIQSLRAGEKFRMAQSGLEQYQASHRDVEAVYRWIPKMDLKDTRMGARVAFDADLKRSLVNLDTQFKVEHLTWQVDALSREPTVLNGAVSAQLTADLKERKLNVENVSFETGGASLNLGVKIANVPKKARGKNSASPGMTWGFDVVADLPAQEMQRLFDAIPHALRTELDGLTWRGSLGLHFEAHGTMDALSEVQHKFSLVPSQDFQVLKWPAGRDLNALNQGMHYEVQDPNALQPHTITIPPSIYPVMQQGITVYTPRMTADDVRLGYPDWVIFDDINPWLVQLITTTEDGSFFTHQGFSPLQVKAALEKNVNRQAFSRGASTISMQLVKNLFFDRTKTISRKFQEVIYTWLMESVMRIPKKRIMELYFNIIEFGPEIYGIEEAAKYYFGKRSRALSLKESAFLMAIIPSPRRGAYYRSSPKLDNGIQKTMSFYIREMYRRKCDPDVLARMRARAAKLGQPVTFEPCCPPRDSLQLMIDSDTLAFYLPDPNNPAVYGYRPDLYTETGEPLVPMRTSQCGYRGDSADAESTESIFESFLPETMPSKELNNN
ncbi:MAG: transglycosylase domain-containing protein [Proteobacteria bacterium]|nr:transglycosylase domain-containing protein [Pseudomonadota bacterium]